MRGFKTLGVGLFALLSVSLPRAEAQNKLTAKTNSAAFVAQRETHRGIAFGFLAKNGYYGSAEGLAQIDQMAALNVKWVNLIVTVMQDTYHSTRVYKDYERTPNDAELEQIIDRFHERRDSQAGQFPAGRTV